MKPYLLLLTLCACVAHAQEMYRWVDQQGKVHYGDRPPPAREVKDIQLRKFTAPSAEKTLSSAMLQAMENFPVSIHVTANCTVPCKEGKDYLGKRGIPFEEINVVSNEEIAALRALLGGGDVVVPVLQVGGKTTRGFLESAWAGLLDAAGYPKSP